MRAFSDDKQVHNSSCIHSYIFTSTDAIISSRAPRVMPGLAPFAHSRAH